jgi:hypothetical protein
MIDFSAYILCTKESACGSGMYVYIASLQEDYELPYGCFGPLDVFYHNCLQNIKNIQHEEIISRYD